MKIVRKFKSACWFAAILCGALALAVLDAVAGGDEQTEEAADFSDDGHRPASMLPIEAGERGVGRVR
ncbi:MAG TPA: hypothetical protein VNE82_15695 [Candidatus Binataceae bacterium]|nr:hypothetical protein [Candidatus Binataceae bacterium]